MKFELNNLPRNCSEKEIITEIKRVDGLVNKNILTINDFDQYSKIHSSTLRKRFGNWQEVLTLAGLENKSANNEIFKQQRGQRSTDDEILAELQRIAKVLNKKSITIEDWRNHSEIGWESIINRRFGSWAAGLEKAGLRISPLGRRYSLEDYFENLLNVWTHYGRQPFYGEMEKPLSKISAGAYESRFGNWRKALVAFVARMNQENPTSNQIEQEVRASVNPKVVERKPKIARRRLRYIREDKRGIGLALRYKVLTRDKFKCIKCGASPATEHSCRLHIDHMIPFSKGGKTILENLQTLCDDCNLGKGNRHSE